MTILGIVIGVAGVIIIIALGAGAKSLILGQVTKLGSNLLSVQPGKSNEKGPPAQVFGIVVTTMVNADADALRNSGQVPHASAVVAAVQGTASVTWQNKSVDTNFDGTEYTYPDVVSFDMKEGQFFNQSEGQGAANVAVLGSALAKELFGESGVNPIGQVVKINKIPLRIIGVIAERGSSFFQDNDDRIFIPLLIGQQQIKGIHYLDFMNIKVDDAKNVDQTITDVKNVMNQRHHIQKDINADYTVRNIADAVEILSTITNALSLFLTAMASIALVVGGIGILNIMLLQPMIAKELLLK